MAIETASDLDFFFDTDEFGINADFSGSPVRGIIDNPRELIDLGIDAERVEFTCRTSDVQNVQEGASLTIDGVSLTVVDRDDDGTGITTLQLRKASPQSKLFSNNEDESVFFETDAFGITVTFTNPQLGAIVGILDTEDTEVDVGGNTIDAPVPILTCPTSVLVNVVEGSTLRHNSKDYRVKNRLDDGSGVTELELFEYNFLDTVDNFYRPDGISAYFQPDGESYYLRAS